MAWGKFEPWKFSEVTAAESSAGRVESISKTSIQERHLFKIGGFTESRGIN